MNLTSSSSYRALLLYIISFSLFGVGIWALNVIVQSSFPGNKLFPIFIRSVTLGSSLMLSYYVNYKFSRKNELNSEIVKFRFNFIKLYLSGALLAIILIATMWAIIYLIYPFKITQNFYSKSNLPIDIISYGLGNTLEELLFRGFLLIATIKLLGKASGVLFVSFLFGLFHLQGTGLTTEGLRMVMTTFSMSLLFISTIYYTKSIWTAVVVHITGNLLLHTLGFDGTNSGLFQITFVRSNVNGIVISIIYEIVVITFTLFIFSRTKKQI